MTVQAYHAQGDSSDVKVDLGPGTLQDHFAFGWQLTSTGGSSVDIP